MLSCKAMSLRSLSTAVITLGSTLASVGCESNGTEPLGTTGPTDASLGNEPTARDGDAPSFGGPSKNDAAGPDKNGDATTAAVTDPSNMTDDGLEALDASVAAPRPAAAPSMSDPFPETTSGGGASEAGAAPQTGAGHGDASAGSADVDLSWLSGKSGCVARRVDPTTASLRYVYCVESADGSLDCNCELGPRPPLEVSTSGECETALETTCGISNADRASCGGTGVGACRPDGDDEFQCVCVGAEDEWVSQRGGLCENALQAACGVSCESELGTCGTRVMLGSSYNCDCEAYGTRAVGNDGEGCDAALLRACDPQLRIDGTGPCNAATGYCTRTNDGRWACKCVASGIRSEFAAPLPAGEDPDSWEATCDMVLGIACGPLDEVRECQRDTPGGSAQCLKTNSTLTSFECECDNTCPGGLRTFHDVIAGSCDQAMNDSCGVDGPTCN